MTRLRKCQDFHSTMKNETKTKQEKTNAGCNGRMSMIPDEGGKLSRRTSVIVTHGTSRVQNGSESLVRSFSRFPRIESRQGKTTLNTGLCKSFNSGYPPSKPRTIQRCQSEFREPIRLSETTHSSSLKAFNHILLEDSACPRVPSSVSAILCRDYSTEVNTGVYASFIPYFANWTISGFKHDKVLISNMSDMSVTKEVTPEFVQYIKERDAALEEAKKTQVELRETQCKLYDAIQLIEKLEKKGAETPADAKSNKAAPSKTAAATTLKKPAAATGNRKKSIGPQSNGAVAKGTASTTGGASTGRGSAMSTTQGTDGVYHPPFGSLEPVSDSRQYYWKIAEKFPNLTMFLVLDAEKKFMKADADKNGCIDMQEMDKVLSDTVGMFTQKQLDEMMKEVDLDNSNTLDFLEVLTVINKLVSRKKTNLPQLVQNNYTKTCAMQ